MKYSKALRESVKLRKKHPVTNRYYPCPLCDEVRRRNHNNGTCLGCPLDHEEPSLIILSISGLFRCGYMAELIHQGDKEFEKSVLEMALAYELAGD